MPTKNIDLSASDQVGLNDDPTFIRVGINLKPFDALILLDGFSSIHGTPEEVAPAPKFSIRDIVLFLYDGKKYMGTIQGGCWKEGCWYYRIRSFFEDHPTIFDERDLTLHKQDGELL